MPGRFFKLKYLAHNKMITTTLGVNVDDVKMRVVVTNPDVSSQLPELKNVELGIERPGHFCIDHVLATNVTRCRFHSNAKVLGKTLKVTLEHHHRGKASSLEAELPINPSNKLVVRQDLLTNKPKLKYELNYNKVSFEPSWDFGSASWAVAVKQKLQKGHVKLAYYDKTQKAEIEWQGPVKVVASTSLASGGSKMPFISLEKELLF
eukprot:TRINITY_DN254_c0_g1_i2.p1 TRINITY_DN254_c0_g1~~TRINITY_DN254_c0_g1_i2.p1  ORF type:complete len:206 (-),score=31.59 TRINITY_DN254_c0_g1_i2:516-1133(-)